ncbi:MAG TPA: alpha/beta hydrolase [Acidimicrobiales bacterium]|jgi:acetyl esterase|nr:alpha/beta hydrolase [Acidimicrobiales bacterium]
MPGSSYLDLTPEQARLQRLAAALPRDDDGLASIEELVMPGRAGPIPARVYRPAGGSSLPVIVYLHGGGWVVGDLETHDATTSALAARSGGVVVSVDYRLAPEYPFPAGLEDCYDALAFIAAHGSRLGVDATRLAVAGDSAGGNLAAAVCLLARDRGTPPITFQLLVYPATDHFGEWGSYAEYGDGRHGLSIELLHWFSHHYLPDPADAADWRASPVRAADLSGLPPALVLTAEYDPLRDEGAAYAARLAAAGVTTVVHCYPAAVHGFFALGDTAVRQAGLDEAAAALRAALFS